MKDRVFITGVTGQDGSILSRQFLTETSAFVYGLIRRNSAPNMWRLEDFIKDSRFEIVEGDITDMSSLIKAFRLIKPDKIFNMAAQSHVRISFEEPIHTSNATGIGVLNILEAARQAGLDKSVRIYQASSSEMFGEVLEIPQTEETPFRPQSPYAVAKAFAHYMCRVYREAYGMFISCGILFNHESEYRGENFVTRKITLGLAKILTGESKYIKMGNLDAKRDWGYAPDYMKAARKMLDYRSPEDFVISTGETRSVKEFLEIACSMAGLKPSEVYRLDERFLRPLEVNSLIGDSTKAFKILGWSPTTSFDEMVYIMLKYDLELVGLDASIIKKSKDI